MGFFVWEPSGLQNVLRILASITPITIGIVGRTKMKLGSKEKNNLDPEMWGDVFTSHHVGYFIFYMNQVSVVGEGWVWVTYVLLGTTATLWVFAAGAAGCRPKLAMAAVSLLLGLAYAFSVAGRP